MAKCNYCDNSVSMPYTCSLCGNKYCGKHRLAESHECINVGVYQTEEYRQQKIKKNREMESIKSGSYSEGSAGSREVGRSSILGRLNFWTSDNNSLDAFYGGVILGISAFLGSLFSFGGGVDLGSLNDFFITALSVLIFSGIFFMGIYFLRNSYAQNKGIYTYFRLFPIGIAITLITSLFYFRFLVFGFYFNEGGRPKDNASVAKYSISLFVLTAILGRIIIPISLSSVSFIFLPLILDGIQIASFSFFWYGILLFIPIQGLDGWYIFNYERRNYWIMLGILIILFFIFFLFF